jgi:peptidoglycan hydrolase-like protein with peptidoglycan-binding domain
MKNSLMTAGIALALGVVWTAGPALAQQTTGEKIENKAEKVGDKLERAADKTGEKARKATDKAEDKTDRTADKGESKMDKVKDKARELKDKVKAKTTDKMDRGDKADKLDRKMDRMNARAEHRDVMAMQQALRDKGHDPGPVDGVMGPRTRAALMDYQRKEGITPTGSWNDETATKLGVRMSSAKTPTDPAASVGTTGVPASTPEDKPKMGEKPARPASP